MTNKTEKCPRQLETSMDNNICYCTSPDQSHPVCSSVIISANTTYSQVDGTINGYEVRSPNSFHDSRSDINQNYVDGVSLTYNRWSFAAAKNCGECPYKRRPPSFVGNHYNCDSLEDEDGLLWDGDQCGLTTSPWFYRQLPQPTTSDIEMRVCRDEERSNGDVGITYIEIYIQ